MLQAMVKGGLITLQDVRILHYGAHQSEPASPAKL
jgi:hypothetical protein